MKIRTTGLWLLMMCAGLSAIFFMRNSAAQTPEVAPVSVALTPPDTALVEPSVKQESRPMQLAVCNKIQKPLDEAAVDEISKLMIHVVANDIYFRGAAYVLFELGVDKKLSGTWMPCVQVRRLDGLTTASPKSPYYETTIPALKGIAATCNKEAPGPAACKAALANYLSSNGLIAIGSPRITDHGSGTTATSTIWVPYGDKI